MLCNHMPSNVVPPSEPKPPILTRHKSAHSRIQKAAVASFLCGFCANPTWRQDAVNRKGPHLQRHKECHPLLAHPRQRDQVSYHLCVCSEAYRAAFTSVLANRKVSLPHFWSCHCCILAWLSAGIAENYTLFLLYRLFSGLSCGI